MKSFMMKNQLATLFPLLTTGLIIWLGTNHAGSDPDSTPTPTTVNYDFTKIDATVRDWIDKKYYPGAALRIVKDGHVVYDKCFGNVTPHSVVSLASATKWLEAAGVMAVVDEGKIDLDAPLSKYLPQFKGEMGKATVRQCLSHTSGINSIVLSETDAETNSIADRINQLAAGTMPEKPGTHFTYGGNGLNVAARVAEVVTGKPWEIIFAEKIAKPCQMHETATGMNLWYVNAHGGNDFFPGSSLADYSHFLEMLANDGVFRGTRVLSSKAISEMQADEVRGADISANPFVTKIRGSSPKGLYGFGEWREVVNADGKALVLSCTGWYGYYPWIDKSNNAYGVFVGNSDNENARKGNFPAFFMSPTLSQLADAAFKAGPITSK
jgi:CubicO group peptidase (beta-lactamase class C family)